MVNIKVNSHVELRIAELPPAVLKELIRETTHKDPLYAIKRRQGYPTRGMPSKILTHELSGPILRLWRGAYKMVTGVLKRHQLPYMASDRRLWLPKVAAIGQCSIKLRAYQEKPVALMIKRQQTIVRAECGSGKTEMLLAVAAHFSRPTLVLVDRERHQKVWLERIPLYFNFEPGGIGGAFSTPKLAPITVGLVQSVRNRIDVLQHVFSTVLCDEVSRFAAETLRDCVNTMPAAVRVGASDDERRRDGREFLLYSTFGKTAATIHGVAQADVEIVAVPTSFDCGTEAKQDWVHLIEALTTDNKRNKLIVKIAAQDATNGHRVLVWTDRVEHSLQLVVMLKAKGISVGLLLGGKEWKDEADRTEAGLQDGTVSVGVGTNAEAAMNIPPLDRGIITCASADRKLIRFRQIRGRLARPYEGKRSRLYYLWDQEIQPLKRKLSNIKRMYSVRVKEIGNG